MQFIAAAFLSSASVRSNFLSFSTAGENTTFKILPQVYKHGDLILQIKYLKTSAPFPNVSCIFCIIWLTFMNKVQVLEAS